MAGIVARPAVAEPDVEKPIRTERQMAAVVVRERLRDEQRVRDAPQRKSNREPASATTGSLDRRNRATTVWPALFVKLT